MPEADADTGCRERLEPLDVVTLEVADENAVPCTRASLYSPNVMRSSQGGLLGKTLDEVRRCNPMSQSLR